MRRAPDGRNRWHLSSHGVHRRAVGLLTPLPDPVEQWRQLRFCIPYTAVVGVFSPTTNEQRFDAAGQPA